MKPLNTTPSRLRRDPQYLATECSCRTTSERQRQRREVAWCTLCVCIIWIFIALVVWAVWALVGVVLEEEEIEKEIAQIRMDRAYLTGGRQ